MKILLLPPAPQVLVVLPFELSPQPQAGRTDRHGLQGSSLPPLPPGPQRLSNDNHGKLLDEAEALASNVDAPATTGGWGWGEHASVSSAQPASGFHPTSYTPGGKWWGGEVHQREKRVGKVTLL